MKPFQEIGKPDLQSLIGNVTESNTLDFKRDAYFAPPKGQELPPDVREKWKRELCADIVSFANADGGWIICGMEEEGGTATEITGLGKEINPESEIARLEQVAYSGIEPPVPSIIFHPIELEDKLTVILIRIPRSYAAPHRVKATGKFHIRRSGRKDEMDISELRSAFNLSGLIEERIRLFRQNRIDAISIDDGHEEVPVLLKQGVRLVVHSVPFSIVDMSHHVPLESFDFVHRTFEEEGRYEWGNDSHFNFDGIVVPVVPPDQHGRTEDYYQIFRNGTVEYVMALPVTGEQLVSLFEIEREVIRSLGDALSFQAKLNIAGPLSILVGLVNAKGFKLAPIQSAQPGARLMGGSQAVEMNRDKILLPNVLIDSPTRRVKEFIRPVFDVLWNTARFKGSRSFDVNGDWRQP